MVKISEGTSTTPASDTEMEIETVGATIQEKTTTREISRIQSATHAYSASSTYAVGDLVVNEGQVFRNTTAITVGEAFDPSKWTLVGAPNQNFTETFEFTNYRFFGEVGRPRDNTPAWTETFPNFIGLSNRNVFGVNTRVVQFADTTSTGAVGAEIPLTAQDWVNISTYGAAYSGVIALDPFVPQNQTGCFIGLQRENTEYRYGMRLRRSANDKLELAGSDDGAFFVELNGIDGPDVVFNQFAKVEIKVPPGLGDADVYVNDVLLSQKLEWRPNIGGPGSKVTISSGSSPDANRVFFVANYGVTIYENSSTLDVSPEAMAYNDFTVLVPPGNRDYNIRLPTQGRNIGDKLSLVAENIGGTVTLQSEPVNTDILFSNLRNLTFDIVNVGTAVFINVEQNGNKYQFDLGVT